MTINVFRNILSFFNSAISEEKKKKDWEELIYGTLSQMICVDYHVYIAGNFARRDWRVFEVCGNNFLWL